MPKNGWPPLATDLLPRCISFGTLSPLYAAIMGGLLAGVAMIILFRHQGSLGGLNIIAHWLQERFGWRAGYVQLAIDVAIIGASLTLLPPERIVISLVGAAALNLTLAINHRPGTLHGGLRAGLRVSRSAFPDPARAASRWPIRGAS
ncbi:MAG: YitT family protein [Candidatus Accumulibacter sp. UW25]